MCEQAERRWAAKVIRKQAPEDSAPPLQEYVDAVAERMAQAVVAGPGQRYAGQRGQAQGLRVAL